MVNINLSTGQSIQTSSKSAGGSQKGMIIVLIILLVVALISGGLMVWKNMLTKKISAAEAVYEQKLSSLWNTERNKDIVDFQSRLSISDGLVTKDNTAMGALQEVEKNLVSGAYLTSFKLNAEKKELELAGEADNYETVARQVVSFKGSKSVSGVTLENVSVSGEGKVVFFNENKS